MVNVIDIVFWLTIIIVTLICILFVATASMLEVKKYINFRTHKWKKNRRNNRMLKMRKQIIKAAPTHLHKLMLTEYIIHFESFVLLLGKINWPDYPEDSIDEDGVVKSATKDELEDYEEELEWSIEEENKLYSLYIEYLQSNNFNISQSELSYVVELYQNKYGGLVDSMLRD